MRTATPKTPVYFYECTASHQRLFYFLPHVELKRLAKKERIRSSIVADFPDGLEIEISPQEIDDFKKEYCITLTRDPYDLWLAFSAILLKVRDSASVRGLGYIRAQFLEKVATHVGRLRERMRPSEESRPTEEDARLRLSQTWERDDRIDAALRGFRIPEVRPDRRLAEQDFCKIAVYKGETALTTCVRLHQTKRTANAGRSQR